MRSVAIVNVALWATACASAPRGPTDAEVRALLDTHLQEVVAAVSAGNPTGATQHFAPNAEMNIRGLMGGNGEMLNVDLSGTQQIRSFLAAAGTPPDFWMQVSAFERNDLEAQQSGRWSIAGEQTGTFVVNWRQNPEGLWQVVRWRFDRA